MSAHSVARPKPDRFDDPEGRSIPNDSSELMTDARLLAGAGAATAAMLGVAQAEIAAGIALALTTAVTLPIWLRARRLERPVTSSH